MRFREIVEAAGDRFVDKDKVHSRDQGGAADAEHDRHLAKTGFWGAAGAGAIVLAQESGRILLSHRSRQVEEPGTWGNFGGAIDRGQNPATSARREIAEECGYVGPMDLIPLLVFSKGDFRYFNFLAVVDDEFTPRLGWEAQGYRWCEFGDWPSPLHFGLVSLFNDAESVKRIKQAIFI